MIKVKEHHRCPLNEETDIRTEMGRMKQEQETTRRTSTSRVCERRVIFLVYSLSLHRHSYIGFILAFASSIHNKQQPSRTIYQWSETSKNKSDVNTTKQTVWTQTVHNRIHQKTEEIQVYRVYEKGVEKWRKEHIPRKGKGIISPEGQELL